MGATQQPWDDGNREGSSVVRGVISRTSVLPATASPLISVGVEFAGLAGAGGREGRRASPLQSSSFR